MISLVPLPPVWQGKFRCAGACMWPITVNFTLTSAHESNMTVEHHGETSTWSMGRDWRTIPMDVLKYTLEKALEGICVRTMCLEYGGQHGETP